MASMLQYTTSSRTTRERSAMPTATASMFTGPTAAFVAHNCAHDVIFSDVYLRTNRTNHTKIMRCFPHCCPDHRKRSYCGSPIHLQLHRGAATSAASLSSEDLVVYGRFRPHTTAPFVRGDRVPVAAILASLQSENPSQGEWVESTLVRVDGDTRHHNNSWLFEVNPSGRWYYPWSGAATIAMRATEHVFEALAFRRVGADLLEFVAGAASPNFRLMSFRRGVANGGGKTAKATAADPSDGSEEPSPKRAVSVTRKATPTVKKRAREPSQVVAMSVNKATRIEHHHPAHDHHRHQHAPMHLLSPAFAPTLLHPHQAPMRKLPRFHAHRVEHQWRSEPPSSGSTNTLTALLPWLQQLPASTIGSRAMLAWERVVQDACEAHVLAARNGKSGSSARAGLVPILSALHVASASSPALRTAPSNPSPLDVIDAAVRVLLYLWLDLECTRASDASAERLLRHGFQPDRQQFAVAHAAYLRDTEAQARRYLRTHTRVSWDHVAAMASSERLPSSEEFSHRHFVAQYRQRSIGQAKAHRAPSRVHQKTHVPLGLSNASCVWVSRMEDVSIDVDALSPNALSLLTVLQFWKHLSYLRLDHSAGALAIASVFNTSVSDGCFTRLVLDGKPRWFDCLPSGDATTGTTLMGYVVGDYVGYATSAGTIHMTTYMWPSDVASGGISAIAYAWHWTLDATSLATNQSSVSVVVESAHVQQRLDAATSFETMNIGEKMRAVGRWHHVCQAQLAYQAQ